MDIEALFGGFLIGIVLIGIGVCIGKDWDGNF